MRRRRYVSGSSLRKSAFDYLFSGVVNRMKRKTLVLALSVLALAACGEKEAVQTAEKSAAPEAAADVAAPTTASFKAAKRPVMPPMRPSMMKLPKLLNFSGT